MDVVLSPDSFLIEKNFKKPKKAESGIFLIIQVNQYYE